MIAAIARVLEEASDVMGPSRHAKEPSPANSGVQPLKIDVDVHTEPFAELGFAERRSRPSAADFFTTYLYVSTWSASLPGW